MNRIIAILASLCICASCVNRTENINLVAKVSAVLEVPEMTTAGGVGGAEVASRTYTETGSEAKATDKATVSEAVFYIFDGNGAFISRTSLTGTENYNLDFPKSGNYAVYVLCNMSALIDLPETPTRDELESLTIPHCESYDYLPFAGKTVVTVTGDTPTIKIVLSRINSAIRIENRSTDRVELLNATVSGLPSRGNIFDTGTEAAGVTYSESAEAEIDADGNAVVYSFLVPEEQMADVKIEAEAKIKNTASNGENATALAPLSFIDRLEAGKQATALMGYINNDLKIGSPENWGNAGEYELSGGVKLRIIGGEFFNYNNAKALRAYSGGSEFAFTVNATEGVASLKSADGSADWVTIGDGVITVSANDGATGRECRIAVVVGGNNVGMFYIVQGRPIAFTGLDGTVVENDRVVIVGGQSTAASVGFDISTEELDGMEIVPVGNGENGITVTVDRKAKSVTATFLHRIDASEVSEEGIELPVVFKDINGAVHSTLTFVQRPAIITFDPEKYRSLSSQGGIVTVAVTIEGGTRWAVKSIADKNGGSVSSWLTKLSPSSSATSGGNFELEAEQNEGNNSRTAYVRIESRNTISKPYAITQLPSFGIKAISAETNWDAATTTLKAYSKGSEYKFSFETEKAISENVELAVDCTGANGFTVSDITHVSGNIYAFTLTVPDSDNADKEVANDIIITANDGEMGRFTVLQAYKPTFVSVNEEVYGGVKNRPELKKATYRASEWDIKDFTSSNEKLAVTKVSDEEITIAYAETLKHNDAEQVATVTMNLKGGNSVTYTTKQVPVAFTISDADILKLYTVSKKGGDVSVTVNTKAGAANTSWQVVSVSSGAWFTTTPSVGGTETNAGGSTLTVHSPANTGGNRSGSFTLESLNTTSQIFTVFQNTGIYAPLEIVNIGGMEWTMYNLANPRQASGGATFATELPSELTGVRLASHGKFYQWNRNVAWNSTGTSASGATPSGTWMTTNPSGPEWTDSPCPYGFRLPTNTEFQDLINTCNVTYMSGTWSSTNCGYVTMTDKTNSANRLEFPAVGSRNYLDGALFGTLGTTGYYWSLIGDKDSWGALLMLFNYNNISVRGDHKLSGFSVRCIRSDEQLTVNIGGVEWAKYNLANPKQASGGATFATKQPSECSGTRLESHGKFYKWNTTTAWATTGNVNSTDWSVVIATGSEWTKDNDPCPNGFRVPKKEEFDALIAACTATYSGAWSESDYGYLTLTDNTSGAKLQFPAVGCRSNTDGALYDVGTGGRYWTSESDASNAFHMYFISSNVGTNSANKRG